MASNTPITKRLRGRCPLDLGEDVCMGDRCRFIKKNCMWQKVKRWMPARVKLFMAYKNGMVLIRDCEGGLNEA